MAITIYHNPRCSKSRATLAILDEQGISPRIVNYLETPPSAAELQRLLELLGITARDLLRDGEAEYQALGLDNPTLTDDDLIAAMVQHPLLIQRPIVVDGDRAVIGRPPERVRDLL